MGGKAGQERNRRERGSEGRKLGTWRSHRSSGIQDRRFPWRHSSRRRDSAAQPLGSSSRTLPFSASFVKAPAQTCDAHR